MTRNHDSLSRREFFKLGAYGLTGAFLPQFETFGVKSAPEYGRVVEDSITLFQEPSFSALKLNSHKFDSILPLSETVTGDPIPIYNPTWYRIGETGYAHSSDLQPVDVRLNKPVESLPSKGALAEVTVPFSDVRRKLSPEADPKYRFYYGSNHWVDQLAYDENGIARYRVKDDLIRGRTYFIDASHMRLVPDEELGPIRPEVPLEDKRVDVYLAEQVMICYEGNDPVRIASVSTGDEAANPVYATPRGSFSTFWKKPSRHMRSVDPAQLGDYDLHGVPYVSYITLTGFAFHGVYWHNDFGRPRSHGCINLTPADAKFLFRWTQPSVPPGDYERLSRGNATRVEIY